MQCVISGFFCSVNDIFTLLGCCAVLIGLLPMFWDNLSVPSGKVKQSGLMGYPETSVTNYQLMLHNIP